MNEETTSAPAGEQPLDALVPTIPQMASTDSRHPRNAMLAWISASWNHLDAPEENAYGFSD